MNKGYLNNGFRQGYRPPLGSMPTAAYGAGTTSQAEPLQTLAMAYVPNQKFEALYPAERALQSGTLFAALDLPYCTGGRT